MNPSCITKVQSSHFRGDKNTDWKERKSKKSMKWSERSGAESDLVGAQGGKKFSSSTQESAEHGNSEGMSGLLVLPHGKWSPVAPSNVSPEWRTKKKWGETEWEGRECLVRECRAHRHLNYYNNTCSVLLSYILPCFQNNAVTWSTPSFKPKILHVWTSSNQLWKFHVYLFVNCPLFSHIYRYWWH